MKQSTRPKKFLPSTRRMRLTLRLRQFGMRWSQMRLKRRLERETLRTQHLQAMVDSQLLMLKALEERISRLDQSSQELLESLEYRLEGKLPELPPAQDPMDQLLGL